MRVETVTVKKEKPCHIKEAELVIPSSIGALEAHMPTDIVRAVEYIVARNGHMVVHDMWSTAEVGDIQYLALHCIKHRAIKSSSFPSLAVGLVAVSEFFIIHFIYTKFSFPPPYFPAPRIYKNGFEGNKLVSYLVNPEARASRYQKVKTNRFQNKKIKPQQEQKISHNQDQQAKQTPSNAIRTKT